MKLLKKLLAAGVCAAMALSMCACHGKDETALTIDGVKITTALYASALFECDSEARSQVDSNKAAENSSNTSSTAETDYYAEQIEGQNFVDYVKSRALQRCREYAFYQKMIDNGTLELKDEEKATAESYADYYWSYYSTYYEPNGVSLETYKKAFTYSYYSNAYFLSIYGEGGEKQVDAKTISDTLNEKFVLANVLTKNYEEGASAEAKAALKTTFQGYVDRLKKGEAFKKVYEEVNGEVSADVGESGQEKPQDSLASVLGDKDTTSASDDFDTVKEMKVGDVKLVESDTGLTIYVKKDIMADAYYLKSMNNTVLTLLKQEEFDNMVKEKTADMKVDENKYATNRFKVKKLVYPEAQSQG